MSMDPRMVFDQFQHDYRTKMPGWVMFARVWGSHAYNTALPSSDVDFAGVFVCPNKRLVKVHPPNETFDVVKPDAQFHELRKFCDLLLKGNPGIVEYLYTDKLCYTTEDWHDLKKERRRFISKRTIKQYIGYAQGQIQKFWKGQPVYTAGGMAGEKWAYHICRLLSDAKRLISGDDLVVWLPDGPERDALMAVRTGKVVPAEIVTPAQATIEELRAKLEVCSLPEEGDEDFLNDWICYVRGM